MATTVTIKGQITLPKAAREAASICVGDRVIVSVRPEGGLIVERLEKPVKKEAYRKRLEVIARRQPLRDGPLGGMTTDAVMAFLRGEELPTPGPKVGQF